MKQIISSVKTTVGYAAAGQWVGVLGGSSVCVNQQFSENMAKIPCPMDGAFKYLYAKAVPGDNGLTPPACTITLKVNGVSSALTVTIPSGGAVTMNLADTVAVSKYDDINWLIGTTAQVASGFHIEIGVVFDSGDDKKSIYGIGNTSGSIAEDGAVYGGLFNNGVMVGWSDLVASNTYSLAPINGTVASIVYKRLQSQSGGAFVVNIVKNGIVQDGAGGTVDTTFTIDDTDLDEGELVISLPFVPTDQLDIRWLRTGSSCPFSVYNGLALSVVVESDEDFNYMLCGGNNNAMAGIGTLYIWQGAEQLAPNFNMSDSPVPNPGATVNGLYMEIGDTGGLDRSFEFTLMKSGVPTIIVITLSGLSGTLTGSFLADIDYAVGDYWNIQYEGTNNPDSSEFHWGVAVTEYITPPPPGFGGIYQMVPDKTNDTLYTSFDPEETVDVKIPDPYAITALLGDE